MKSLTRFLKLDLDCRRLLNQPVPTLDSKVLAMLNQSLTAKRIFLNAGLVMIAALMLSAGVSVSAQVPDYASERRRAFQLMDESKMMEALPILEKLATQNPRDGEVQFYLGFCIFAKSREIKDPFLHKQERLRARDHLVLPKNWG